MARVHGKKTVIILGGVNITQHSNASTWERTGDNHDTTTYGQNNHVFDPGLGNGTATIGGFYDNTAVTGPRAAIEPLVNTMVTYIHRPEGTGSGLPQRSVQVHVSKYTETAPVADMITFAVDLQASGDVDNTPQP